jgi:hypothetical protein
VRRISTATVVLVTVLSTLSTLSGCGLGQDVSSFVTSKYTRAANLDDGTAQAFTAPGTRQSVAAAIAAATDPIDQVEQPQASYLQYRKAIVRVATNGAGSVIRVDSYGNGYRRWAGDVASRWGAYPPDDYDGK